MMGKGRRRKEVEGRKNDQGGNYLGRLRENVAKGHDSGFAEVPVLGGK